MISTTSLNAGINGRESRKMGPNLSSNTRQDCFRSNALTLVKGLKLKRLPKKGTDGGEGISWNGLAFSSSCGVNPKAASASGEESVVEFGAVEVDNVD